MEIVVGQVAGHQLADVMEEVLIVRDIRVLEWAQLVFAPFAMRFAEASVFAADAKMELASLALSRAKAESVRCREGA